MNHSLYILLANIDKTVNQEDMSASSGIKRTRSKSKTKTTRAVSSNVFVLSDDTEPFDSLASERLMIPPKKTRSDKNKNKNRTAKVSQRRNSLPPNIYHDQYQVNKENEGGDDDTDAERASKEDNVSIFRSNLLIQKGNNELQTKILNLQMNKIEMNMKISELELKKNERLHEIEIKKNEALARMELEKQDELKKKELERYDELTKLIMEAKRKELGL